jgi:SAM-dependent methyltransferase
MESLLAAYTRQAAEGPTLEHWSGPPEMVEAIARILGTQREHRVVDLGCGVGGPARRLATLVGCRVIGVDLLEPVVRTAGNRRGGVSYLAGDAAALPLRDETTDQVWALGVVAHLPDLAFAAREMARVLRRGGRVAITEGFWSSREPPLLRSRAPQPWRAVTVHEARGALHGAGFVEIRDVEWPGWPDARPPRDPWLSADLAAGRLCPRMLVGNRP